MTNKICVMGLGYVGLPLAIELSQHFNVIGFDVNKKRVDTLINNEDTNCEYSQEELSRSKVTYQCIPNAIRTSDVIIVTVPTPITNDHRPNLEPLKSASETIGRELAYRTRDYISNGSPVIVYESTVYPGLTEEYCVPIIEKESGLKCGKDFYVGYSPERINPGDKVHTLTTITKIVSGMDEETLNRVDEVYGKITKTHRAPSIRVAEAAKAIENAQRDLNISFVNELALIFDKLGIDTLDVLEAAGTKWNFLPFRPGLVGGHCISVDPYYLTWKAEDSGYLSQVIAAGRRINDAMPHHIVNLVTRGLNSKKKSVNGSKVLIFGITFKEDCKDLRNSKVQDIITELEDLGAEVVVHDPNYRNKARIKLEDRECKTLGALDQKISEWMDSIDAVILAVPHKEYKTLTVEHIQKVANQDVVIVDIKGKLGKHPSVLRV